MNLKEIKELVEFVVKQELNEFEFEQSGFKIKIKRGAVALSNDAHAMLAPPAPAAGIPSAGTAPESSARGPSAVETASDLHIIKSPIVGTFYRSPSPDAEMFVKIGDSVEKGAVLCIIEAMKLMNEIESDVSGEIVNIHVENASPVEYGEPLFSLRLRP